MWKKVLKEFPEDASADVIESTASRLEGMSYEPVLLLKTPCFLRMARKDLEAEIQRVNEMTTQEMMAEGFAANANFNEFKAKHLQLLVYHYNLLCRLRNDDPAAWDTINELYEDD
jgi:trans-2-enoyl-CoA reductase